MPVSDIDIWRSANLLIKQHGERAWTEAVLKYFEMKRTRDVEGVVTWRRIARAISYFTSPLPASGSDIQVESPDDLSTQRLLLN